ncbi:hypothetical protein ANN_26330 [Periplaneta americana]|uniref:Uncharacterized protein n=1 Tax=Periplaneta americana TaxID=6978 RepID=A0ABQ8S5M9_PERAM|nr:hypothetical protein ANN_26330 [Periplaneta americana]
MFNEMQGFRDYSTIKYETELPDLMGVTFVRPPGRRDNIYPDDRDYIDTGLGPQWPAPTLEGLVVFLDNRVAPTFLQGRDSLEDDVRTGRPQTIRTERKIQEVATLHSVPRIPSQDQRDDRMTICGDLISSADDDPTFLNRIITGDETWCFLYDPQLKRQSATWKTPLSPRQKNRDKTGALTSPPSQDATKITSQWPHSKAEHQPKANIKPFCHTATRVVGRDSARVVSKWPRRKSEHQPTKGKQHQAFLPHRHTCCRARYSTCGESMATSKGRTPAK